MPDLQTTPGEPAAADLLASLDSVLSMPIVRLSPHAGKLRVLRTWVEKTDRRVASLEMRLAGLGALRVNP